MVEFSKGFRTGRLISENKPLKLRVRDGGEDVPFIALKLHSEFPIGLGETSEEDTNVLLLGEATVAWWQGINPKPQIGDTVRLNYATLYVKDGVACIRVFEPGQIEVMPQEKAASAAGLRDYLTIEAREFFRMVAEERKSQNNT